MPLFATTAQPGRALTSFGPGIPKFVEFLIIAGGGGAGAQRTPGTSTRYKIWRDPACQTTWNSGYTGSGGGAGGYISSVVGEKSGRNTSPVPVLVPTGGTTYSMSIGAGAAAQGGTGNGNKGGNTSAFGYTAIGGGGGGYVCCFGGSNAGSGGSGGGGGGIPNYDNDCPNACTGTGTCGSGANGSGTSNQGFNGTAGRPGGSGGTPVTGTTSSITGTAITYAKGGGGSSYGDGGAEYSWGNGGRPGAVILRYKGKDPDVSAGLSYNGPTKVGSNQVLIITGGSGNISW